MATTPKPLAVPPNTAVPTTPQKAATIAPTPLAGRAAAAMTVARPAAPATHSPSFWGRKMLGVPVWVVGLVILAGGGWFIWRKLGR